MNRGRLLYNEGLRCYSQEPQTANGCGLCPEPVPDNTPDLPAVHGRRCSPTSMIDLDDASDIGARGHSRVTGHPEVPLKMPPAPPGIEKVPSTCPVTRLIEVTSGGVGGPTTPTG